jgi:predicted Fe-Mo cluster-binding NifX family protein
MIDSKEKNRYKIAIPTNDGIYIFKGMLGRALKFAIFEVDPNNHYQLIEERANPYAQTMQHLKTLDVYDLIDDCSVILSSKIGKAGIERLEERNMHLLFREGNIYEQLDDILKNELASM